MVWVMAASSIIGGIISSRGKKKANRERQKYLKKLTEMSQRLEQRGTNYLDTYDREFLPVAREAVDAARQVGRPDLAAISADNATAFGNQQGAMQRDMQRSGVNPLDGAWSSALGDVKNNEAASLVFNRNAARRGAATERYQALSGAAGLGLPMLQAGGNLLGQSAQTLGAATDQGNRVADGIQDRYDGIANSIGAAAGSFAGGGQKKVGGGAGMVGGKSAGGGMVVDNQRGVPWNSFVSRAGPWKSEFGGYGQAGTMPGYLNSTGQNQWWGVGGR